MTTVVIELSPLFREAFEASLPARLPACLQRSLANSENFYVRVTMDRAGGDGAARYLWPIIHAEDLKVAVNASLARELLKCLKIGKVQAHTA